MGFIAAPILFAAAAAFGVGLHLLAEEVAKGQPNPVALVHTYRFTEFFAFPLLAMGAGLLTYALRQTPERELRGRLGKIRPKPPQKQRSRA